MDPQLLAAKDRTLSEVRGAFSQCMNKVRRTLSIAFMFGRCL
jgi:transcriptional/translational regulatory protein YebC/TACO1